MKTPKVACLCLSLLAPLAYMMFVSVARADDNKKSDPPKGVEVTSPWSATTTTKQDGYFGSTSTTIKRDLGDGWALGGKMTTPYQDNKIGGGGAPGLKQYESPSSNTRFGPVLEKKF